jgi:histidinol-phosphate phosphatase family protein
MPKKTLFLDRDGVINRHIIGGYVTRFEEFELLPGVIEALRNLASRFDYIFIVTNQQGIGKGVFSIETLEKIHQQFIENVQNNVGRIDKIYFCPDLEGENSINRKPNPGMGLQALHEFPDIDLNSAVMVGDSELDLQFGKNLGVKTVFLTNGKSILPEIKKIADQIFVDLYDFATNYSTI